MWCDPWILKEALKPVAIVFSIFGGVCWIGYIFACFTYFLHKKFNFFN